MVPVVTAVVLLAGLMIGGRRRSEEAVDRAWLQVSEELEADYEPRPKQSNVQEPRRIHARLHGRKIEIDHTNEAGRVFTRVRARALVPDGLRLRVTPAGAFSDFARAVGFEDIPTGDDDFDEAYIVKASDPEVAPLWLNGTVRDHIEEAVGYRFKLERGWASALLEGYEDDAERLIAAAEAVSVFADGRQRLLRSWKRLAEEWGGEVEVIPDRWVRLDAEVEGVPIHLDTRTLRDHHYTELSAEVTGPELTPFAIVNEPHLFTSELPEQFAPFVPEGWKLYARRAAEAEPMLDEAVRVDLEELDLAKLRVDATRVTLLLRGVITQRPRLKRALLLALHLATGPAQPPAPPPGDS